VNEKLKHYFSGDSGGGMVLEVDGTRRLVGIISAAVAKEVVIQGKNAKICDLDSYLVYTDVSKFHGWINQVIRET
jgi:secreted trypsin-like serine protease